MKKIIISIISLILLGCSLSNTPTSSVERYLNKYNNLDEEVLMDLETKVNSEDLSNIDREKYKNVLTRQYKDMKYVIKDESINGDKAEVLVKITVYDLYKIEEYSYNYMNEHIDEFSDVNNEFDNDLFNNFRIEQMLKTNNRVDYELLFKLDKVNDDWEIRELNRDDLEKIHGLYDYENN